MMQEHEKCKIPAQTINRGVAPRFHIHAQLALDQENGKQSQKYSCQDRNRTGGTHDLVINPDLQEKNT